MRPEVWVKCGLCGLVWKLADLPLSIDELLALVKSSRCRCGAGSVHQFLANEKEIADVAASPAR